jgi:peptidyl-prolyl cis-trans isomerase C
MDATLSRRQMAHQRSISIVALAAVFALAQVTYAGAQEADPRQALENSTPAPPIGPQTEIRARQILVDTEEEANEIVAALKNGGDFAELAHRSKEVGAGHRAGDLGYFTEESMLPVFWATATALEPGQISDPVKTEFGWHVIKVEDKRERIIPPIEEPKSRPRSQRPLR